MDFSAYEFSSLQQGQFTLHRGVSNVLEPILLVACSDEYPSPGSLQRLEHEHALRGDLDAGWAALPVELVHRECRLTLVLDDPGGEPLERMLGRPMDVTQFLRVSIPLAAVIGRMHGQGLIHRDLKPANILVGDASGGVRLTGFGIASRLPRERQGPGPPEGIAGTFAYMAPEQTGRMNRSVDSRSDLYACGVTLYEMLTGVLPFSAADPMEWIHCHIARQPMPPSERLSGIPASLSAIVMKLLAKSADDRYQTAAGLEADLRRCQTEWEAHGRIESFPLGARDVSERLLLPERLYGREREIDALLAAFDRVVADGAIEFVLVSGYSGIGKSSVVNELHKALVPPHGLFASGKFDQYERDIPYATLAQAFQSLVRQILGKGEVELGEWRDALREALGANGGLIVNLVPELELVIGKQPAVADLPPQDAKNRFQMVFRRFLGVFAREEHPLALFLDDLQWLDSAALDLLEHLLTHSDVRSLLLIGAYRDNEVGSAHPLLRTISARAEQLDVGAVIKASQAVSTEIVLDRLIETLMTIALEHAGAERGLLVLMQRDTPQIEAEATIEQNMVAVTVRREVMKPAPVPESLLNTVMRTRQSVILDDAWAQNPFSADPYVLEKRARSVLCLPLLKQTQLIGVLYLENNLASHVFTPARISLLELLASQAAISLENARLYGELTTSEARWRKLFESVPVGVALTGPQGRYGSVNPAFQRMTGYSETELRRLSPADITHEDDLAPTGAIVAAYAAGEPYAQRIEKRYRRKDGGITWAELSLFPAPMAGSARQLGGIAVDITERKRAEEALRVAQTELAHAARLTTMGELTASIAHEINQPLAGISSNGAAGLNWLNRKQPDLDQARDAFSRIMRDSARASDVIRGLRALAKKSGPQLARLDIDDLIREVLTLTGGELRRHGVLLRTELAASAWPILADRVQLQQVLLNLIMNGAEAMSGVTERARELIVSSSLADPGSVLVSVEDTGVGLDPAVAERLFEPFFTTKSEGLGMGLSICRSIVEGHHGRLWASPRAPYGAAIRFTVPIELPQ